MQCLSVDSLPLREYLLPRRSSKRRHQHNPHSKHRLRILCSGSSDYGAATNRSSSARKDWQVPVQLLSCSSADQNNSTVYTVRFTTSFDRGSALSEPLAAVNVCLIGTSGSAVLHRVSPVNDPSDNARVMEQVCSLAGEDCGADCSSLSSVDQAPLWPVVTPAAVKPRFQEGSIDEVSFLAPELGDLAAVLIAPEAGSWMCDEVDVFSSRSKHMDRFLCRQRLGGRKGEPAAYLTPVPPDAVVYGTGDAARIITKDQAAMLRALSLSEYGSLKARLLIITALLTLGGSGLAALASGVEAAVPFALGGAAGLLYQLLLQFGADAAVSSAAAAASSKQASSSNAEDAYKAAAARSSGIAMSASSNHHVVSDTGGAVGGVIKVLGNTSVRLALLTSASLAAVWALQDSTGSPAFSQHMPFGTTSIEVWQLGLGLCGFMMYKVALLGVSLMPAPPAELQPAQQLERKA